MPIRSKMMWGTPLSEGVSRSDTGLGTDVDVSDLEVFDTDWQAAAHLYASGADLIPIVLSGGDLFRSLGGRPGHTVGTVFEVDLIEAEVNGCSQIPVLAHILSSSWSREIFWLANTTFAGKVMIGPRSHPGDGRVEVFEGRCTRLQVWNIKRRMRSGSHLPHPDLTATSIGEGRWKFEASRTLHFDGRRIGGVRELGIRVIPGMRVVV